MDPVPRSSASPLCLSGAALFGLAIVGCTPGLTGTGLAGLLPGVRGFQYGYCGVLSGLGVLTILAATTTFGTRLTLLWAIAVFSLTGCGIEPWKALFLCDLNRDFLGGFASIGGILLGTGIPFLWGGAMARRIDPHDERSRVLGRYGAGIVQLGFLVAAGETLQRLIRSSQPFGVSDGAWDLAATLGTVGARAALLGASIQSVRTAHDAPTVLARARSIHGLLIAWMALTGAAGLSSALACLAHRLGGAPAADELWNAACSLLAPYATATLVARVSTWDEPGYKTGTEVHP